MDVKQKNQQKPINWPINDRKTVLGMIAGKKQTAFQDKFMGQMTLTGKMTRDPRLERLERKWERKRRAQMKRNELDSKSQEKKACPTLNECDEYDWKHKYNK